MDIQQKIKQCQACGITIKGLSALSGVAVERLYNISSGRLKHITPDESERIEKALNDAERIFCTNA